MAREKKIVRWLDSVKNDCQILFLMGDVFDFWFEYKTVVPRGYIRLLGKLAELSDSGIEIHYFTGNHDMWAFDYLPSQIKMTMHRQPIEFTCNGKKFMIGHGDGLGPGDHGYKFIKKVFASKVCQWLFARLHPNFAIGLGNFWSRKSRYSSGNLIPEKYNGDDKEYLVIYTKDILKSQHIDYFIFGHRHLALEMAVGERSKYINLGDWLQYDTYAVFDGSDTKLLKYEG